MNIRKNTPVKEKFVLETERSYRAILSDTYKILIVNTRILFSSVMPLCAFFGLIVMLAQLCVRNIQHPLIELTTTFLLTVMVTWLLSVMIHVIHEMLKDYTESEMMMKYVIIRHFKSLISNSVPTWLMLLLMTLITEVLLYFTEMYAAKYAFVWIIGILLVLLLQVPFTLSLFRQAVTANSIMQALKWGFKRTFKYFGSTLFLCFFAWVCIGLLGFVCCLPIEILSISIRLSDIAVLLGDPTDLPTSIVYVYYILIFLLLSIFFYFMLIYIISQIMQQITCSIREQKILQ